MTKGEAGTTSVDSETRRKNVGTALYHKSMDKISGACGFLQITPMK